MVRSFKVLFGLLVIQLTVLSLVQGQNYSSLIVGLNSGYISNSPADLWITGLEITPNYGFNEGQFNIGAHGEMIYTHKDLDGIIGLYGSVRLFNLYVKIEDNEERDEEIGDVEVKAPIGGVSMALRHLWGFSDQKYFGVEFIIDLGEKVSFSVALDRDYHHKNWRGGIGINYFLKQE